MEKKTLIEELNLLWEPVRPYLTRQIVELYGREGGHILEIGPFSGLIFDLAQRKVGENLLIAAFPKTALRSCLHEARKLGLEERVRIIESDSSLVGIADDSIDLAVFRGALFFPSLFRVDFGAIHRTLRTGGIAFVGGGFGKYTPPEVIQRIGKRSEQPNIEMGKVRITEDSLRDQVLSAKLKGDFEITTDGGLWVVMRK